MAIKPTITWQLATNTNYDQGPANGFPTKLPYPDTANGQIPGSGIPGECLNYYLGGAGEWSQWLDAGSALGANDAHLVETDQQGKAIISALQCGTQVSTDVPLTVDGRTGNTAVVITQTGTGSEAGIKLDRTNGSGKALDILQGSSGPAVEISCFSGAGTALQVECDGQQGLTIEQAGLASCATLTSTSASGAPALVVSMGGAGLTSAPLLIDPATTDPSAAPLDGSLWTIDAGAPQAYGEARLRAYLSGMRKTFWATDAGMDWRRFQDTPGQPIPFGGTGQTFATYAIPASAPPGIYQVTTEARVQMLGAENIRIRVGVTVNGSEIKNSSTGLDPVNTGSTMTVHSFATVEKLLGQACTIEIQYRADRSAGGAPATLPNMLSLEGTALGAF